MEETTQKQQPREQHSSEPQQPLTTNTKVYYFLDDQVVPYSSEIPVSPSKISINSIKKFLPNRSFKYYCKIMDPALNAEVKSEIRDENEVLKRNADGQFEIFLLSENVQVNETMEMLASKLSTIETSVQKLNVDAEKEKMRVNDTMEMLASKLSTIEMSIQKLNFGAEKDKMGTVDNEGAVKFRPGQPQVDAPTCEQLKQLQHSYFSSTASVLVKRNWRGSFVATDAKSFQQLVGNEEVIGNRNSSLVVDRSIFIHVLMIGHQRVQITLPSGVGKSVMLTMVKEFCEYRPVEKRSQNLFNTIFKDGRQFHIMDESYGKFRGLHFCRYPTFFLDLSMVNGDFETVQKQLNKLIMGLFNSNSALLDHIREEGENSFSKKILSEIQEEHFQGYMKKLQKWEWNEAIKMLTTLFHERNKQPKYSAHQNSQVIVLIDDFDAPILQQFDNFNSSGELNSITELLSDFVRAFESAPHVAQLLMVGTYRFPVTSPSIQHFGVTDNLRNSGGKYQKNRRRLPQYFGFTDAEFVGLCDAYCFPEELRAVAKANYNGYAISELSVFSTASTLKMLNQFVTGSNKSDDEEDEDGSHVSVLTFPSYFVEPNCMNSLAPLFRHQKIASEIRELLQDIPYGIIGYEWKENFTRDEFRELYRHARALSKDPTESIESPVLQLFLRFLLASGYLVKIGDELSIPNEEMKKVLRNHVSEYYYTRLFGFSMEHVNRITNAMVEIVYGNQMDTSDLANALKEMLNKLRDKAEIIQNEHHMHMLLEFSMLRIRKYSYFAGDYMRGGIGDKRQTKPDILMSSIENKAAICVELKLGETKSHTAEYAMGQIAVQEYITAPKIAEVNFLQKMVALGVSAKRDHQGIVEDVKIIMRKANREAGESVDTFLEAFEEELKTEFGPIYNQCCPKK